MISFESLAATILISFSAMLGIEEIPRVTAESNPGEWQIDDAWHDTGHTRRLVASSKKIVTDCESQPGAFVDFPMVIHGAHTVKLDGRTILRFGDPSFETTRSFYGAPYISCRELQSGSQLVWEVDSYTKYFARLGYLPRISTSRPLHNVLSEILHVIAAGGCLLMTFFTATMFFGRVNRNLAFSVAGSCFFASIYFGIASIDSLGLRMTMLEAHRFADLSVWSALMLILSAMRTEGLLSEKFFRIFVAIVLAGCLIILFGASGDAIQLGTSLPFLAGIVALVALFLRAARRYYFSHDRRKLLHVLSMLSFVLACLHDLTVFFGLATNSPLFPFGFLSGIFFLALAVNEKIQETYHERDFLRGNLENEVARKTAELTAKTWELESAMHSLKSTQAELIQSAKLASLGTLSAGIAHEINNSLNYVNGAMQPLEKLVTKSFASGGFQGDERGKIEKLFGVMREGLQLTLEIIKSLRSYTGLNQAKFNDVNLRTVAQTSTTILRNKLRGKIEVQIDVPEALSVYGSVVGINQVFMNLLSNAIDAMKDGGTLTIKAALGADRWTTVTVADTGCGMSRETAARVFEPFFTTKDVGSGTGLGLHIVKGEIERHRGEISLESAPGKGTTFVLRFPPSEVVAQAMQNASIADPTLTRSAS